MVLIRLAKTSDARGLAVVRVVARQVGFEGMADAEFLASLSVDEDEELWRNVIATRGDQIRVAAVDDRVVGFAIFGPYRISNGDDEPKTVGELYGFSVHPDSWGTGVANELHDAAVDELRARNLAPLKLWVFEENGRARRFYERHGWVADGVTRSSTMAGGPIEVRYELNVPS